MKMSDKHVSDVTGTRATSAWEHKKYADIKSMQTWKYALSVLSTVASAE